MKKFFVIPLLFLYMVATSGIIVHLHYCGEEIESWALNKKSKNCCQPQPCEKENPEENNCCKDKVLKSKMSWEQSVVSQFKLSLSQSFIVPQNTFYLAENNSQTILIPCNECYLANAPPGNWQYLPLYKLHASLTYYG